MKNTQQKIDTNTITALAQKDYNAFQKGIKSYELINWLKEELVLCEYYKKNELLVETKALAKMINVLGLFRERNLDICDIKILDRQTAVVKFKFDFTTLHNSEIRKYNSIRDINIPENTVDQVDETYAHMIP